MTMLFLTLILLGFSGLCMGGGGELHLICQKVHYSHVFNRFPIVSSLNLLFGGGGGGHLFQSTIMTSLVVIESQMSFQYRNFLFFYLGFENLKHTFVEDPWLFFSLL